MKIKNNGGIQTVLVGKYSGEFLNMLKSFDDLGGAANSAASAIIQTGDLVFISETIEGSGFIGIVDEGDGKATYQRVYIDGDTVKLCTLTHAAGIHEVSRNTIKIRGRVTGFYRKLDDVPLPDDRLENTTLFKKIDAVHTGRYDASWAETVAIMEKNHHEPLGCIFDAFRYGFLKGQRAEKAKAKK
ncbi:MAG: hypothetical protein RR365_12005, partial [Bacteroides sp.]